MSQAASRDSADSTLDSCINYRWVSQGTSYAWTVVGEVHEATDIRDHYFAYGNHADSNIEWGVKSGGTITIGGTVHIGNAMDSVDYKHTSGDNQHWQVLARFLYEDFALYADCQSVGWRSKYMGQWMTEAQSHDDHYGLVISYQLSQPARNAAYTTTLYADGGWSRWSYQLAKISAAVSISGFSFGAQSGASQYVGIYYRAGTAESRHYIYGSNAMPGTSTKVYETNR